MAGFSASNASNSVLFQYASLRIVLLNANYVHTDQSPESTLNHAELPMRARAMLPRILTRGEIAIVTLAATKKKFTSLLACSAHIFIKCLPCLLCDIKANRISSFLLPDGHAINSVSTRCNTQLRQELLSGIDNPSVADNMLADTVVAAYRNLIRIQGWIGSTAFTAERELFGQEPLESTHGYGAAMILEARVENLEQTLMSLLDRAQRMMIRAIDRLEARRGGRPGAVVSIGRAEQVNLASNVQN